VSLRADWIDWRQALLGAAIGGGGLWLLAQAWWLLRKEEGMGLGDVKMLAMVGAFLGWQGVLVTVFLGSLAGALVGLALIGIGRLDLGSRLPFGVFLAGGALVALFAGPLLVARYSRML
jgi:leader peptidase (prepilin peptidase) / N-methyltransferase